MKQVDEMASAGERLGRSHGGPPISHGETSPLTQLAAFHGIQTHYTSMAGEERKTSEEVLLRLLNALGVGIRRPKDADAFLGEARLAALRRGIEPVLVQWAETRAPVRVWTPRGSGELHCEIRLEDGSTRKIQGIRPVGELRIGRETFVQQELSLPRLPEGYHQLTVRSGKKPFQSMVIVAPLRSYTNPELKRSWGVFAPMYAIHNQSSWGAGGFAEYGELMDWLSARGGKIAGTLPLLAAFLDKPVCDPSPYSPASRLFWNDFYIDIHRIPELTHCQPAQRLIHCATFAERLRKLRSDTLVNYPEQASAQRAVVEVLAEYFFSKPSQRRKEFDQFIRTRPELEEYATFRAVCDAQGKPWTQWPARLRNGDFRKGDYSEECKCYYGYAQWIAHQQLSDLVRHGEGQGVHMYLDLPLGVHPDGYDAWRQRDVFAQTARVGCPPDPCFPKGQDWGFSPLHPQRLRESGYRYLLDYLRFQMGQTGLLRIDHVMCLHRLYWIPEGKPATHGGYVSYPSQELHAIFNLESHRNKCVLIGENLGTVPPQVNEAMERHQLRQMYVVQYEGVHPAKGLRPPPKQSIASLNTHDMPPFAAHWAGKEITERANLGLLPKSSAPKEISARKKQRAALVRFLNTSGLLSSAKPDEVARAALKWLAQSDAEMVLLNLEDLWGETESQNIPGTLDYPNWRRKFRRTLEELSKDTEIDNFFKDLARMRKGKKGGAVP